MTAVLVVGFIDVEKKPRGPEWTTRFPPEHQVLATKAQLADPEFVSALKAKAKALGLHPSGKQGAREDLFDPVFKLLDASPHEIAPPSALTDKRKTAE